MKRLPSALATAAVVAAAPAYVLGVLVPSARLGVGKPSFDTFEADYPNILYTLRAVHEGHGLLWNRLQNCGQPFLASTLVGLFYPLHWVTLLSGADLGILVVAGAHLAIAGLGAWALGRELGMGVAGALTAALCVELGGVANDLAGWLPYTVLGAYAWLPVALWRAERLVRAPSSSTAIWLAAALTMQLLVGYPHLLLFSYEVVALRVVWELATRRQQGTARLLAAATVGLVLPLALGAVQLLPMIEFARESVRNRALDLHELAVEGWTVQVFRHGVAMRMGFGNYAALVPLMLAPVALLQRRRRIPLFWVATAVLFAVLAFENPLAQLYRELPFGTAFRDPGRFLILTHVAIAVLAGFGADAVAGLAGAAVLPCLAAGAAGFMLLGAGLFAREWWALAAVVATAVWAWVGPAGRGRVAALIPVVAGVSLFVHGGPFQHLIGDPAVLQARRATFDVVRSRLTLQERVDLLGTFADFSLMPKTASVLDVPSIHDYEPQTSQRYAELLFAMIGAKTASLADLMRSAYDAPISRAMLNLLAVRYVVVGGDAAKTFRLLGPEAQLHDPGIAPDVRVFRNVAALPRAFFVPTIEVESADTVPRILASPVLNPRLTALVDTPPADGFLGGGPPGGQAGIVADTSEEVMVQVDAPGDGFLFLADVYYPGWEATVNGVPTPIVRGNHAFRLVRVPAGRSSVVFRYRPASVRWGALLSAVSLLAVLGVMAARRRADRH